MTVQISNELIVEYPQINLGNLKPYAIVHGDIDSNHGWGERYEFIRRPKGVEQGEVCSALWRGYVATFVLKETGALYLIRYDYPFSKNESEEFEERIEGDFWLVLKEQFFGARTYLPFVDSIVDADEKNWKKEELDTESMPDFIGRHYGD